MSRKNRLTDSHLTSKSQSKSLRKRGLLGKLTDRLTGETKPESVRRGRLLLESLEKRQMMAGDVDLFATDGVDVSQSSTSQSVSIGGRTGAGEAVVDLVAFAKLLKQRNVKFYGADWCPFCRQQKELFGDGKHDLPFVEVTNPDRSFNSVGIREEIRQMPTWVFPGRLEKIEGVQSLARLAELAGVTIPTSDNPTFQPIGSQTVAIGSPLHVPIDAYDPGDGPLTTTVSVANEALLEARVLTSTRSLRIDVENFGVMVVRMFETQAPRVTDQIISLAQSDFYDSATHANGMTFHRVAPNFVIQAGSPNGQGTDGSSRPNVDDQFHPDLQHNRTGVLSFAKTGTDDTNNSQFFITTGPQRSLDFNHSVMGQLVEGFDVLAAINRTPVSSAATGNRPLTPVKITSVEVFQDTENSVVILKPKTNTPGATQVTITVTDSGGRSHSETVDVFTVADTTNNQPYLNDIPRPASVPNNQTATLQLSAVDVEGDAVRYSATKVSPTLAATVTANPTTGLVQVTPPTGFVGTVEVRVAVQRATGAGENEIDTQIVPFTFTAASNAAVDAVNDNVTVTGNSGETVLNLLTNDTGTSLRVTAVTQPTTGGTVTLNNGVVRFTPTTGFTGNTTFSYVASNESNDTDTGTVTVTVTAPSFDFATVPPSFAFSEQAFTHDVTFSGITEGGTNRYSLVSPPSGAVIDPISGVITWTPTFAQIGSAVMNVRVSNGTTTVTEKSFNLTVKQASIAFDVQLTNLAGQPITTVKVGEEFNVTLVARDTRASQTGIFSAFAGLQFDSQLVKGVPGSLQHLTPFDDPDFIRGTVTETSVQDVGATLATTRATNTEVNTLARFRMRAAAPGTAILKASESSPSNNNLLFDENGKFGPADINYGAAILQVTTDFLIRNDTFVFVEDGPGRTLDVLTNDVATGTLAVTAVTQPTTGGTVILDNGQVRFTPTADFSGTTTFTYTAGVTGGSQGTATVTITVTPVNDSPVAVADTYSVGRGEIDRVLDVLANDTSGPDSGETLIISEVRTPSAGGTVRLSADRKSILYTPSNSTTATETFTYVLSDGSLTSVGNVTINLDAAPTAVADLFTVIEDATQSPFAVLGNDTPDTGGQTFKIISVGTPSAGGTAAPNADGSRLLYSPGADRNGTETVTYTIEDTGGGRSTATVTFTITAVNDPPPSQTTNITLRRDQTTGPRSLLQLSQLPANVDSGETLTFTSATSSNSTAGTVSISANNQTIQYVPNFSSTSVLTDVITYIVSDGRGLTSTGTINVRVEGYVDFDLRVDNRSFVALGANELKIKGTDVTGATVDRTATVAADGTVSGRLLPGTYQIELPAVPVLQNGQQKQMIAVVRTAESLSSATEVIQPTVGRLRPEFLYIEDFLGSTSRQSVLVAAVPGASTSIVIPSAAVANVTGLSGTLDTNARTLTLKGNSVATTGSTGTVTAAAPVEAVIPVGVDRRVQSRGTVDSMRVYRVNLNPSATTFSPVTTTAPATTTNSPTTVPAAARALSSDAVMAQGLPLDDIDEERNTLSPASTDEAIASEFGRQ